MGFLTKKIKDKSKREKIIIIVGVFEILALVFFGLTQRWGWDEGYHACVVNLCNNLILKYPLIQIQQTCYNFTGVNASTFFCQGDYCP